jgi:hypothetical protein
MRVTAENMWLFELQPLIGTSRHSGGFASALEAVSDPSHSRFAQQGDNTSSHNGARSLLASEADQAARSGPIDIHGKPDLSHAVSTMTAEEEDRMFRLSGEIRGLGNNAAVPPGSPAAPPGYFYDPATGYQPGFTLAYGNVTDYMNPIKGILKEVSSA